MSHDIKRTDKLLIDILKFNDNYHKTDLELIDECHDCAVETGNDCSTQNFIFDFDEILAFAKYAIAHNGLVNFKYPKLKKTLITNINDTFYQRKWNSFSENVKETLYNIALETAKRTDGEYIIEYAEAISRVVDETKNFQFSDNEKNKYTETDLKNANLRPEDVSLIEMFYERVRKATTAKEVIENLGKAAAVEYARNKNADLVFNSLNQNQIYDNCDLMCGYNIVIGGFEEWVHRAMKGMPISIRKMYKESGDTFRW